MIPDEKKKTKKVAAPKGLAKFPKLDIWAAPPAHATTFTAPVTHHVPVTAADQSLAALISALGSGGNSAQVAASMAAHDVQAELAALRQAQAQANAAAASRASQIGGLASQAAQFTSGLGDQTAAQYRSALADTQGLASGFSDMARADADAQAAAAQQQIAASGGSAPVSNEGSALANVLYGLGGKLPGDVIQAQGIGSTAAARMVPVSLLQYGQQGAAGALQAGAEQAASYQPDITRAIGSQGSLAQQYLSALESSRQNQLGNMIEAYKLQQSASATTAPSFHGSLSTGIWHVDPKTGRPVVDSQPTSGTGRTLRTVRGVGLIEILPDGTSRVVQKEIVAPKDPSTQIVTIGKQQWVVDKATGAKISYVGPARATKPSTSAPTTKKINGVTYQWDAGRRRWVKSVLPVDKTKKPGGPLTATQSQHLRAGINSVFYGVPEQKDASGKVTRAALLPGSYQDAIREARRAGYTLEQARKMANRIYKPGLRGRPGVEKGIRAGYLSGPPAPGRR